MSSSNPTPGTYTAQMVADILHMGLTEVYRAAKAGEIPGRIEIGNRTRFSRQAIDRFVDGEDNAEDKAA
jgi:predicted DNA-binding transcriptional regulator AlpA